MDQHRYITAAIVGLGMRASAFRFTKDYRHGVTRYHRAVYAICSTVAANSVADGMSVRDCLNWGRPARTAV